MHTWVFMGEHLSDKAKKLMIFGVLGRLEVILDAIKSSHIRRGIYVDTFVI